MHYCNAIIAILYFDNCTVRIYNDCIVVELIASTLIVVLAQFFDFL